MTNRLWDSLDLPAPLVPFEQTFEGFLGLEWLDLSPHSAHVRFEVRNDLKQPLGLLHGGIYCSVAETVASVATVHAAPSGSEHVPLPLNDRGRFDPKRPRPRGAQITPAG